MALEAATLIGDLVPTNPTGNDARSQGDDHIRMLKAVLRNTFPNLGGAVTRTAAQLNAAPYNQATMAALLGGSPVYAAGDFSSNGTAMQNPAPAIALGWNNTTKRLHGRIDTSFITGGFLVDSEFLGGAQSAVGAGGHQRLTGTMELHWGTITVTQVTANTYTESTATMPRGFTSVMGGWVQLVSASVPDAPIPQVSFPSAEQIRLVTQHAVTGTFTYKWFAVGYRT